MFFLLHTIKFILNHPLNRKHRMRALLRYMRWQVGSRLVTGPVLVPFIEDIGLFAQPGMTGATGNIYCGLHEFEDMALVLHTIQSGDFFVDVGANVGSYTLLACAGGGDVLALEPIPSTYRRLKQNISVNGLDEHVEALNIGVGAKSGQLRFCADADTVNHVVSDGELINSVVDVSVQCLDDLLKGRSPILIKIDVEGYESHVLDGAVAALEDTNLLAIIIELNGSGMRYGIDDESIHQKLLVKGFKTFSYAPFDRALIPLHGMRAEGSNTIYVRDVYALTERIKSSRRYLLGNGAVL